MKGLWEERFERIYGFWRGFIDDVVNRYLDCGLFEAGFARVYCDECHDEFLVALSCKGRGFCPSCSAKRAAIFAAFLREEVLEPVGHAQWVFSMPKMLRPYFLYHPELLGKLCRATYETVQELMAEAAIGVESFRTGMVVVVQTAGDLLNYHPHTHAIAPRGGWDGNGEWVPIPYVDTDAAERLFRNKVLSFLKAEGLLSEERLELLLSWSHHTGFSAHNAVTVAEGDDKGLERLSRYLLRPPLSHERMHWDGGQNEVVYTRKGKTGRREDDERFDPLDFLARVLMQIPEPKLHYVR